MPPRSCEGIEENTQQLLGEVQEILLKELETSIEAGECLKSEDANRLHLCLTWMFTGCPEEVTGILLNAALDPQSKTGEALVISDQGRLGRLTVESDEQQKTKAH